VRDEQQRCMWAGAGRFQSQCKTRDHLVEFIQQRRHVKRKRKRERGRRKFAFFALNKLHCHRNVDTKISIFHFYRQPRRRQVVEALRESEKGSTV
jgi:hypothetical protein